MKFEGDNFIQKSLTILAICAVLYYCMDKSLLLSLDTNRIGVKYEKRAPAFAENSSEDPELLRLLEYLTY